ncbi:MAG: four helix bundle protein [Salinivirgaceae bacterium]|nr:four helix bundle protein [Salinivirgaceae bacterium]
MATITDFEDLDIWKLARNLCQDVNDIIINTKLQNDYKLREQINGSTGSIMDNIAEGFDRGGKKEFRQFLSISKGSCAEARSQLTRVYDRKYITKEKFENIRNETLIIGKKIGSLIKYLNTTTHDGIKFKK